MSKSLPNSVEAEKAILQAMMHDAGAFMRLDISEDMFADQGRKILFREILDHQVQGEPINPIALTNSLRDSGELDLVGGPSELADIWTYVANPHADGRYYADVLKKKLILRQICEASAAARSEAMEDVSDVGATLATIVGRFLAIGAGKARPSVYTAAEGLEIALAEMQAACERGGGLSTGFAKLDEVTGGLHPCEQTVLAARTSVGKSSFALNIAENVASKGSRVLVISMEMGVGSIWQRQIANRSQVMFAKIREGKSLTGPDFGKITRAMEVLAKLPLTVIDRKPLSIEQLTMLAVQQSRIAPIDLLITDYLQLIRADSRMDTRQKVSEASAQCKALADRLNTPHLLLAQLNRPADDREPKLSDLKESADIENDADNVWLLDGQRGDPDRTLIVAKSRNGQVGDKISLEFQGANMQWR